MTNIAERLQSSVLRLRASSPSARLDAETLLAHVLGKTRTYLKAWPETPLTPEQSTAFDTLIDLRAAGRPVAYLTGSREFWSREFIVTPDVLIPRPETELLVEVALMQLRLLPNARILDLATGSGAIAVTLAAECPTARVYASDISTAALEVARRNVTRHAVHVELIESDWFAGIPTGLDFDLIVGNPPYIADADPHLGEGDVRFEPRLALSAGPDGLDAYRTIAAQAPKWLSRDGLLLLEHGYDQADAVRALLERQGFRDLAHRSDLHGHQRTTQGTR